MMTLKQACIALKISYPTLEKWLGRLHIEPTRHPADRRFYQIDDGVVERVRSLLSDKPETSARAPAVPRKVTILSETPQAHVSESALSATKAPRPSRSGLMAHLEALPEDWIAFNTGFCKGHGDLDGRSIDRDPLFPKPHDRGPQRANWWRGHSAYPQGVRSAYDREQHLQAARLAYERWPGRFRPCAACQHLLTPD